jgi:AraC-like DNA-binding protein
VHTTDFDRLAGLSSLRKFYRLAWRLFRVNIALVHPEGVQARRLGGPRTVSPFCARLHSAFPQSLRICRQCDRRHLEVARLQGRLLRYRCFAGLNEYYIPIALDGEILAFLQCGQILDREPGRKEWERTRRALAAFSIDAAPLEPHFHRIRVIPPRAQEDMVALLDLFGNYIARAHQQLSLLAEAWNSQVVGRARSFINNRLASPLALDEIARAACTSKRNLTRVFLKETGMTVVDFIHERRIDRACRQLSWTRETCARIAYTCGFGSIQQFNRVFRQLKGAAPSVWRRGAARLRGAAGLVDPPSGEA